MEISNYYIFSENVVAHRFFLFYHMLRQGKISSFTAVPKLRTEYDICLANERPCSRLTLPHRSRDGMGSSLIPGTVVCCIVPAKPSYTAGSSLLPTRRPDTRVGSYLRYR